MARRTASRNVTSQLARLTLLALLLAPGSGGAEDGSDTARHRGTWYAGGAVGFGAANVVSAGGARPFSSYVGESPGGPFSASLRGGGTLTDRLLVGVEAGMSVEVGGRKTLPSSSLATRFVDASAVFFPWSSGVFGKLGVGYADLALQLERPRRDSLWQGVDTFAALGWSWWIGKSFNTTIEVALHQAWYFAPGPDATRSVAAMIGMDWY